MSEFIDVFAVSQLPACKTRLLISSPVSVFLEKPRFQKAIANNLDLEHGVELLKNRPLWPHFSFIRPWKNSSKFNIFVGY
jgi:hypothetical protein